MYQDIHDIICTCRFCLITSFTLNYMYQLKKLVYLRWRWRTEEAAWSTSLPDPRGCLVPPPGRSVTDCDAEERDSWSRTFL